MTNFFPFILVSVLFFQSVPHGLADEQLITTACARTTIPDACKSVLMSDSRSMEATTVEELIQIAFDIAVKSTIAGHKAANNLLFQYTGKAQYKALFRCAQLYEDMVTALTDGKTKADQGLFEKAVDSALDAEAKPDACDTEFVYGNMLDLMLETNHDLTKKCAVAASLASLKK